MSLKAEDFVELISQLQKGEKPFALGTIQAGYVSGKPRVKFDGEEETSLKGYNFLTTYTPVSGDRVLLAKMSGSYVIMGSIGDFPTGGSGGQDGVGLEFTWSGTSLGVKREDQASYTYVNLKGDKGDKGDSGTNGTNGADGQSLQFTWSGTSLGVRVGSSGSYTYVNLKGDKGDTGDPWTPTTPTLVSPPYVNGWSHNNTSEPVRFYKSTDGTMLVCRGSVKNSSATATTNIFTLPTGYRPSITQPLAVACNGGYLQIEVRPSGEVIVIATRAGSSTTFVHLNFAISLI